MHKLTRSQRLNKRRGKGKGWNKKSGNPSPHIFATEKWVVTPPIGNPMSVSTEAKAMHIASAIAREIKTGVEVDHQRLNDEGDWVSVED
jgi:hypothetical protein